MLSDAMKKLARDDDLRHDVAANLTDQGVPCYPKNLDDAFLAFIEHPRVQELLTKMDDAIETAQEEIDKTREALHQRRVADWHPEGAHNAAAQMSEDMRLLGNHLADVDIVKK